MTFGDPISVPASRIEIQTEIKIVDCSDVREIEKQVKIMAESGWKLAGIANRAIQGWAIFFQKEVQT